MTPKFEQILLKTSNVLRYSTMLDNNTKARFRCFLCHPARKWVKPILQLAGPARGIHDNTAHNALPHTSQYTNLLSTTEINLKLLYLCFLQVI